MGIKNLNSFIKSNVTKTAINKITIESLSNKVIVVDTSIYLYRFLAEEALLENMYIMLSLFRYYNITPIFVFDGKAPIEKAQLLDKRNKDKDIAEEQYNKLKELLKHTFCSKKKSEISEQMIELKKKFIRITKSHTIIVQELMGAFGISYIEAEGEADIICAKLVIKKIAYACLSEDMDLFIYGCPRVLRYLSLLNETVVIYYLNIILDDLKLSFKEFKEISILSGTDYNYNTDNNTDLYKTWNYFTLYKTSTDKSDDFYLWLDNTTNYIDNIFHLYNVYNMFMTENIYIKKIKNKKKDIDLIKIKQIMKPEGFIFI